jgi:hypothetical protein
MRFKELWQDRCYGGIDALGRDAILYYDDKGRGV